jgi:hypothetical protein
MLIIAAIIVFAILYYLAGIVGKGIGSSINYVACGRTLSDSDLRKLLCEKRIELEQGKITKAEFKNFEFLLKQEGIIK